MFATSCAKHGSSAMGELCKSGSSSCDDLHALFSWVDYTFDRAAHLTSQTKDNLLATLRKAMHSVCEHCLFKHWHTRPICCLHGCIRWCGSQGPNICC